MTHFSKNVGGKGPVSYLWPVCLNHVLPRSVAVEVGSDILCATPDLTGQIVRSRLHVVAREMLCVR